MGLTKSREVPQLKEVPQELIKPQNEVMARREIVEQIKEIKPQEIRNPPIEAREPTRSSEIEIKPQEIRNPPIEDRGPTRSHEIKPPNEEMKAIKEDNNEDVWSGFYKKNLPTRIDQLRLMYPGLPLAKELPDTIADNMIENCIGTISLPLGLGLNFKVNGVPVVVPMATEEPSIIAAVSGAAKTITQNGGFKTSYTGDIMVGQIQLLEVDDIDSAAKIIIEKKEELMEIGNQFCMNMKKREGGVVDIAVRILPFDKKQYFVVHSTRDNTATNQLFGNTENRSHHDRMIIVHVHINVCDSMGANTVNTVVEGIAPRILDMVGGRLGLRIVTNFCVERRSKAQFRIPIKKLGYKNMNGEEVAKGIIEGYALACEDPYRAVTHNKGIMNGVDAVAIALGQDFRAIESGAHAWACRNGKYQPLSSYRIVQDGEDLVLEGNLELPTPIGVRGGSIQSHPTINYTHALMNNPNCATVGEVIAMVGLAQNFAALRAMISEGIQRGHMSLHSRNMAIQAGAPPTLVPEVASYLVNVGKISVATATEYLKAHSIMSDGRTEFNKTQKVPPSTLLVEFDLEVPVSLNIVFESLGDKPYHLSLKPGRKPQGMQSLLFGRSRDAEWFKQIFSLLGKLQIANKAPRRSNLIWQYNVKSLSVLVNLLLFRLVEEEPAASRQLAQNLLFHHLEPLLFIKSLPKVKEVFLVGAPLLSAIFSTLKHEIDQVSVRALANALNEEQRRFLSFALRSMDLATTSEDLEQYLSVHSRRYQITFFLLCDLFSVNPTLITPASLRFMVALGSYLETEAVICRDIAYSGTEKGLNSYQFWLRLNNKTHSTQNIEEFRNYTKKLSQENKDKLIADKGSVPFFDLGTFIQESTEVVQHYYNIMEIMIRAYL